jgi:hypothetical protein
MGSMMPMSYFGVDADAESTLADDRNHDGTVSSPTHPVNSGETDAAGERA